MGSQVGHLNKMIKEVKAEKGDLNVIFVDFSSDSQRKNGATPVRDKSNFPVLLSKSAIAPGSFSMAWDPNFRSMTAWRDVVIVLDSEGTVAGVFDFNTNMRSFRQLKKGANYNALKKCILEGYKSTEKADDEDDTKKDPSSANPKAKKKKARVDN